MKIRQILRGAAVFLAGAGILAGCGKTAPGEDGKIYVGVTYYNQTDTYLGELLNCLKKEWKERESEKVDITVTVREAAGSQRTQDDQVKEMLDAGCNVLCVNLVDRASASEIIDLAREKDVPVIFFNREPVAEDLRQWEKLYYVGADARQSGSLQGELAADLIWENEQIDRNRDGTIQYVVLEGEPGHQDTIIRTENAVDTMKSKGIELEKLSYGIANWNRVQAQNRMEQMIGQHQNDIELVLANNDAMALGAIDAYKKLNYTESTLPVFLGIDGTAEGLQAVRDGSMYATVYNDKEKQAEVIAELAVSLSLGQGAGDLELENGKSIYLPYRKVTRENVSEFPCNP